MLGRAGSHQSAAILLATVNGLCLELIRTDRSRVRKRSRLVT